MLFNNVILPRVGLPRGACLSYSSFVGGSLNDLISAHGGFCEMALYMSRGGSSFDDFMLLFPSEVLSVFREDIYVAVFTLHFLPSTKRLLVS